MKHAPTKKYRFNRIGQVVPDTRHRDLDGKLVPPSSSPARYEYRARYYERRNNRWLAGGSK